MEKKNGFLFSIFLFLFIVLIPAFLVAAEIGKGVQVTFLGHSAFKLVSSQGVVILIDPFLRDNPKTPAALKEIDKDQPGIRLIAMNPRATID